LTRIPPKKQDEEDSTAESPAVKAPNTNGAASPPSVPSEDIKSPRSSPRIPTTPIKKPSLQAVVKQGKAWFITLKINGQIFLPVEPPAAPSSARKRTRSTDGPVVSSTTTTAPLPVPTTPLGNDGNMFHCHMCEEVGDVVCCDGCPNVYHRKCIPIENPSRKSLENDEDPWFCPRCFSTKKKRSAKSLEKQRVKVKQAKLNQAKKLSHAKASATGTPKKQGQQPPHTQKEHQRACCECNEASTDLKQCEECQSWMHHPPCQKEDFKSDQAFLCSNCRSLEDGSKSDHDQEMEDISAAPDKAESKRDMETSKSDDDVEEKEAGDDEEDDDDMSKYKNDDPEEASKTDSKADDFDDSDEDEEDEDDKSLDELPSPRRQTRSLSMEEMDESSVGDGSKQDGPEDGDDNEEEDDEDDQKSVNTPVLKEPPKKRRRPSLTASSPQTNSSEPSPSSKKKDKTAKKKKKKKKKQQQQQQQEQQVEQGEDKDASPNIASTYVFSPGGNLQATPAFYFYLAETRPKIERNLSRKHRYFNRLPKGYERNELVAKEGAVWWTKLRPTEVRRYMNMSMRDFEQRIIEWKEEKNIRDMLVDNDIEVDESEPTDMSFEDELLTYANHERLYLGTTVGSKPFKPETGVSHNRVLLELLQDMRFHPVPMFMANRTNEEYGEMDFARITIPYFDVHGPISTSVGDECLGCTRGWTHFCSVLKRRIPAVEHRAKLQPPLSSLVATRVGLGLRPRPPQINKEGETEEDAKKIPLFVCREVSEVQAAKNLPIVPWDSLTDPSSRADDIVQFIEEALAMKVPEPARPDYPGKTEISQNSMFARATLPTRGRKRSFDGADSNGEIGVINKCGRCRTVIQTDTGCVQCRRAQLVINMSKRPAPETKTSKTEKGIKSLKAQTYMLGRVTMKEGSGEVQPDGDQAIGTGILRQRWTPFTILPPHTLESPTPKTHRERAHSDEYSATEEEEESSVVTPSVPKPPPNTIPADDSSNSSGPKEDAIMGNGIDEDSSQDAATNKSSRLSSKRLRSARIAGAAASTTDPLDEDDRQRLAEKYKQEADVLHKKCLTVACCGILLALMRRDPLLLFAEPVTAEGYSVIIKNPIDFGKIRTNVLGGKYATLGSFVSDCRLLCTNALAYNPPGSIYWKTAKELYDVLAVMQKRVSNWMGAVKDGHAFAWRRAPRTRIGGPPSKDGEEDASSDDFFVEDPFEELRKKWPEAVEMLETSDWLRTCISADFMRTKENETAYYGALAARRAAIAAEASLAPYPDTGGVYNTISRRSHVDDESLRRSVDDRVAEVTDPIELKDLPTWREESIVRVMRRAQSRRLEGLIGSINGCARCDGMRVDQELKMAMTAETVRWGRTRRKNNEVPRVNPARVDLSSGLSSQNTRERIERLRQESANQKDFSEKSKAAGQVAVRVGGSRIHGWGLYADQHFKKGDVVAEYIGEYVSLAVTEAREKMYQEQRIQDYQFRLDDTLVIDATMRGGHGRYINHNCSPNCVAKMIPGSSPNEHLKRVIITAQRNIEPREELTYDYQFPLELDLDARIPCNCHSEHCRGFMNWDLPEKGSNNRVFRSQKRGANMRDRIRRLGRPLKSDKDG
jgi:hypothetical protein